MFSNLDDVVLNVELRVLEALELRLKSVLQGGGDEETPLRLAQAYFAFTHEKPRLWNLLFEHYMPNGADVPEWYQQKLEALMACVETSLIPFFPNDAQARHRSARVLWAGVHGITSLSTTNKLSNVTSEAASQLVSDLVGTYLAGLVAKRGGNSQ